MKPRRCKPRGEAKPSLLSLPDCGAVKLDVLWDLVALTEERDNTLLSRISF